MNAPAPAGAEQQLRLTLTPTEVNVVLGSLDRNPLGLLVSQIAPLAQKIADQANAAMRVPTAANPLGQASADARVDWPLETGDHP